MNDDLDIKILKSFCIYTYHWLVDAVYVLPPNTVNKETSVPADDANGDKVYVTQIFTLDHEITIDGRRYRFTSVRIRGRKCLLVSKWSKSRRKPGNS